MITLSLKLSDFGHKKAPETQGLKNKLRGSERIRTAVQGFADLYLATRSRNQIGSTNIAIKHS